MLRIRRTALTLAALAITAGSLPAQVQQGAAAGTLQLSNITPAARDALFAGMDAYHAWAFSESLDQLNRALSADSSFALARAYRAMTANAATAAQNNAEYVRAVRDAASRTPPEITLILAMRAAGANRNRLFATARAMYPGDRRIALEHALSYVGEERIDSLRALAQRHPDLLGAKLWLAFYLTPGTFSTSRADLLEALIAAQDAVRLAPNVAGTHTALGHVLNAMGREEEAVAHINAAIRLDPRQEYAYYLLSEIYADDGKPRRVERARAALDSAIAVNPNPVRRRTQRANRAFLLFYDGRAAEGMKELEAVARDIEQAGGAPAVLYSQMAGLAAGTGDSASVEKWLTEARRVGPDVNVRLQTIHAYALNRQGADARRVLEEFKRTSDTTTILYRSDVARLNAMVLLAEGKAAEALAQLKRIDPYTNFFVQLAMMEAYVALKDQKSAEAVRAEMLERRDMPHNAVSKALANYRAAKKR